MVNLAALTDPVALPDVLAAAVGLRGGVGDPFRASVALLGSRPWLVLVDNCEHLLDHVHDLVAALMDACQELTVLATSRQRLGLPFERVCAVGPLALPEKDQQTGLELVPSVAVFLDRAKRVRPDFQPDSREMRAIADVVQRLDGIPLAIELAAGRLSSLDLWDLVSRLDRVLDLLGSDAGLDDRHRTLRAALQWSYDLLPDHEQRLFRHLAVFPDGFALDAAEDVAHEVAPQADPAVSLAHLVDASMVVASFGNQRRYRMLDTIRTFGLDRLHTHDEHDDAIGRFCQWAERLVRWIDMGIVSEEEALADKRLAAEIGNLRAAWQLARSSGNLDLSATMVVALHQAGVFRDHIEIWQWANELACDPLLDGHHRAASVLAAAAEARWRSDGDIASTRRLATLGLALAHERDPLSRQRCLLALGAGRAHQERVPAGT